MRGAGSSSPSFLAPQASSRHQQHNQQRGSGGGGGGGGGRGGGRGPSRRIEPKPSEASEARPQRPSPPSIPQPPLSPLDEWPALASNLASTPLPGPVAATSTSRPPKSHKASFTASGAASSGRLSSAAFGCTSRPLPDSDPMAVTSSSSHPYQLENDPAAPTPEPSLIPRTLAFSPVLPTGTALPHSAPSPVLPTAAVSTTRDRNGALLEPQTASFSAAHEEDRELVDKVLSLSISDGGCTGASSTPVHRPCTSTAPAHCLDDRTASAVESSPQMMDPSPQMFELSGVPKTLMHELSQLPRNNPSKSHQQGVCQLRLACLHRLGNLYGSVLSRIQTVGGGGACLQDEIASVLRGVALQQTQTQFAAFEPIGLTLEDSSCTTDEVWKLWNHAFPGMVMCPPTPYPQTVRSFPSSLVTELGGPRRPRPSAVGSWRPAGGCCWGWGKGRWLSLRNKAASGVGIAASGVGMAGLQSWQ